MALVLNPFTGTFDFTGSGGGGTTSPSAPVTSVQFNDSGSFGGSAFFEFDKTAGHLAIGPNSAVNANFTVYAEEDYRPAGDFSADVGVIRAVGIVTPSADQSASSGALSLFDTSARLDGTHNAYLLFNYYGAVKHEGTGTLANGTGLELDVYTTVGGTISTGIPLYAFVTNQTTGTVTLAKGVYSLMGNALAGGTITSGYGMWAETTGGGTFNLYTAFYAAASGGLATNAYDFWADEQGVFRIKADNTFNSVYQAIPALYNPQVTKYTPGAANFERIVLQWESNIGTLTTEKGGTGTLRTLNLGDSGVLVTVNGVQAATVADVADVSTLAWLGL